MPNRELGSSLSRMIGYLLMIGCVVPLGLALCLTPLASGAGYRSQPCRRAWAAGAGEHVANTILSPSPGASMTDSGARKADQAEAEGEQVGVPVSGGGFAVAGVKLWLEWLQWLAGSLVGGLAGGPGRVWPDADAGAGASADLEEAVSWKCFTPPEIAGHLAESVAMALVVLALMGGGVLAKVSREGMRPELERARSNPPGLLLSPTIVWAALVTLIGNLVITRLGHVGLIEAPEHWLFPRSVGGLQYAAAGLVLLLGGGTLWGLLSALRAELQMLQQEEHFLSARANGLPILPRLLRGLLSALLARVSSALPVVMGELIVVEYVFSLSGAGRLLLLLSEAMDVPGLMWVTSLFLGISLVLRALATAAARWLHPPRVWEVSS